MTFHDPPSFDNQGLSGGDARHEPAAPDQAGDGDSAEAIVSLFDEASLAAAVPFDRSEWRRSYIDFAEYPETEPSAPPIDAVAKRIARVVVHASAHCPLRADVLRLTPAQAVDLVRPRGPMALLRRDEQRGLTWVLVTDQKRRRIKVHAWNGGEPRWMTLRQFCAAFGASADSAECWIALQPMSAFGDRLEQTHDHDHAASTPLARLLRLLRPDRGDVAVILVYALAIGMLALSTPIAVEALVNTVAFGQLLQPVVVLALMLAVFLGFAAAMRAFQTYTAELIQRRIFVRLAGELTHRLPRVRGDFWRSHYGPEQINRFFEVVTVQKVTAQLLVDGTALLLQTLVGMAVIAFYHPVFLGFDLFLLLLIAAILFLLGRRAVSTAIDESRQKYATAAWLEEMARSPYALSAHEPMRYAVDRTDRRVTDYLVARGAHFRILLRQVVAALALQVVASTVLLGLGGWLVVRGELSLGQLVAAELIVTVILGSFAKIGKHLEGYYDLMAAVDKLGHLLDMPIETPGDVSLPATTAGFEVSVRGIFTSAPAGMRRLENWTASFAAGEVVALTGGSAQVRTAALAAIAGREDVAAGQIEIAGRDLRRINRQSLRDRVALVKHIEIFTGSIADNIHLGRASVSEQDISDSLRAVRLLPEVLELQQGLSTQLVNDGGLSRDQRLRLMLARAIAGKPSLLLLDGTLDAIPDEILQGLVADIRGYLPATTIVIATGRGDVAAGCLREVHLPCRQRSAAPEPTVAPSHAPGSRAS